jgi:hypothetical protein
METDQRKAHRDKLMTSLILGAAFVITVLCLIFGLSQKINADRNLEMAIANEKIALFHKSEADKQRDIANEQIELMLQREKELAEMTKEVEAALLEAQKKLADCSKKK